MNHSNITIIAFVGLVGSGRTAAVDYLCSQSIPKIHVGRQIIDGARDGIDSEKDYAKKMRSLNGNDYFILRPIEQIKDLIRSGQRNVVIDGLYTWPEYKTLKREFAGSVIVIAIVTPKHLRKQRMAKRPVRPMTSPEVDERDRAEIEDIEKGGPIAAADYYIHNDSSLKKLQAEIDKVVLPLFK